MALLTGLVCSQCGLPFYVYRPTRAQQDEPLCNWCQIASFEGVCRLLGLPKPKTVVCLAGDAG